MKHRKGSWSQTGGNHMAKILCLRATIGLDTILGWRPGLETAVTGKSASGAWEPLSAAKTPVYDGKGNNGEWLHADMPFEQAFRTSGREAIRGLLRQKRLFDLSLI
jgi:hypothetical protein